MEQRHGMTGHCFAAADGIDLLVGLAFDAHRRDINSERGGEVRPHRIEVRQQLRAFGDHGHVDIA